MDTPSSSTEPTPVLPTSSGTPPPSGATGADIKKMSRTELILMRQAYNSSPTKARCPVCEERLERCEGGAVLPSPFRLECKTCQPFRPARLFGATQVDWSDGVPEGVVIPGLARFGSAWFSVEPRSVYQFDLAVAKCMILPLLLDRSPESLERMRRAQANILDNPTVRTPREVRKVAKGKGRAQRWYSDCGKKARCPLCEAVFTTCRDLSRTVPNALFECKRCAPVRGCSVFTSDQVDWPEGRPDSSESVKLSIPDVLSERIKPLLEAEKRSVMAKLGLHTTVAAPATSTAAGPPPPTPPVPEPVPLPPTSQAHPSDGGIAAQEPRPVPQHQASAIAWYQRCGQVARCPVCLSDFRLPETQIFYVSSSRQWPQEGEIMFRCHRCSQPDLSADTPALYSVHAVDWPGGLPLSAGLSLDRWDDVRNSRATKALYHSIRMKHAAILTPRPGTTATASSGITAHNRTPSHPIAPASEPATTVTSPRPKPKPWDGITADAWYRTCGQKAYCLCCHEPFEISVGKSSYQEVPLFYCENTRCMAGETSIPGFKWPPNFGPATVGWPRGWPEGVCLGGLTDWAKKRIEALSRDREMYLARRMTTATTSTPVSGASQALPLPPVPAPTTTTLTEAERLLMDPSPLPPGSEVAVALLEAEIRMSVPPPHPTSVQKRPREDEAAPVGSPPHAPPEPAKRRKEDDGLCVVCLSEPKSVVVLPCRHLSLCEPCSKRNDPKGGSLTLGKPCFLCRTTVKSMLTIFT